SIRGDLGVSLSTIGRFAEAVAHVEAGLRLWPENALFHAHLGSMLEALDRPKEALESYQRAAALHPDDPMTRDWTLAGLVDAERGDEAIAAFRSWVERDGSRFAQWDGLAELCLLVGAPDDYDATRTQLLEKFGASDDPVVCEKLCRASMLAPIPDDEGQIAGAAIDRAFAVEARRPTERRPRCKLAKAMAEHRAGHDEAALGMFDPEVSETLMPMPQLVRALVLAELGKNAEGLASLARAAAIANWRPPARSSREMWSCTVLRREAESKLMPWLEDFVH